MILDDLNVFILKQILIEKEINTWKISKKYNWLDVPVFITNNQKDSFFSGKAGLIQKRLEAMEKENIIKITKENNKKVYEILGDKVFIKNTKFINRVKPALCILQKNNKWFILEL